MTRYPALHYLPIPERISILSKRLINLDKGAGDHPVRSRSMQIEQLERELWHLRGEMRKLK